MTVIVIKHLFCSLIQVNEYGIINLMDKRRNPNNTDTHRQCGRCGRVLERNQFHKSRRNHDGLFPYCKQCMREMNAERYEQTKEQIAERRRQLKQECVDALGSKCSRCGYNEFVSGLDFHHTSEKDNEVARLITKAATGNGKQRKLLMSEIAKCILLCRNCHSAHHANEW